MAPRWTGFLLGAALWAQPHFEPSKVCSMCHSRLPAAEGNVAPHALWSGTMKANAARDPYWRAKVREEVEVNPAAAALIEDTCLRCHAPAQQYPLRESGGLRFDQLNDAGRDGVTCSVCHQISPVGLGTAASFTAGFKIGGENKIFGPHPRPFTMPMQHHTGYVPTESKHVLDAALCGSCHTVITPVLDAAGRRRGEFIEQAPYLEWLASDFAVRGESCQSCHLPLLRNADGTPAENYIAHRPPGGPFPPTSPRTPFGRHFFAGGNVQVPAMLGEVMPEQAGVFDEAAARALAMLGRAMRLDARTAWRGNLLEVTVDIENRAGHKLPTAYPSRRLWLRVRALDAAGRVLWESGASAAGGQPHRLRIKSPDQAIVYEAEAVDVDGRPTTSLLRSARYRKDNRILPAGFDAGKALPGGMTAAAVGAVGVAGDDDFRPGADRVVYEMKMTGAPARVIVEALYQSIGPEHAATAAGRDNDDARRFKGLYEGHGAAVVASRVEAAVTKADR